jgi:hypothetical protein
VNTVQEIATKLLKIQERELRFLMQLTDETKPGYKKIS